MISKWLRWQIALSKDPSFLFECFLYLGDRVNSMWFSYILFLFLLLNSFWVDQRETYLLSQNDFRTLSTKLINSGLAFMAWYIGFVALFILLRVSFMLMVVLLNYDLTCLFCCCSFVGDGFAFWFIPFIVDIFLFVFHSFFILCCCFFSSFFCDL